jgi:hypothetical protein
VYISSIYAENAEPLEFSKSPEGRSDITSKLHPILVQWQASENPDEFAKENGLSYKDNKIKVYIYLESAELRSKIPPEIKVAASDDKIVVAFVSSEQLDKLDDLGFVERVTPPILMRTPPIPQIEIPETQISEKNQYDYLLWIVFGAIFITTIGILMKRKKLKE